MTIHPFHKFCMGLGGRHRNYTGWKIDELDWAVDYETCVKARDAGNEEAKQLLHEYAVWRLKQ